MSLVSIYHIVQSVTGSLKESLKKLSDPGLFAMAYNNLDFDFKMKEPSDQNQGTFSSITTATFIPLTYGTMLDDLRYLKELWEKNSLNPNNPTSGKSESRFSWSPTWPYHKDKVIQVST